MKPMELQRGAGVRAPRPETITLPGFYRTTDGAICTRYGNTLISITHIPGTDAVKIQTLVSADSNQLYSVTHEEECATHDDMMNVVVKMCRAVRRQ